MIRSVAIRSVLVAVICLISIGTILANDRYIAPLPTENFYLSVNNAWLKQNPIPADKPGINNFVLAQINVNNQLIELLENLPLRQQKSDDEMKLLTLYQSYMAPKSSQPEAVQSLKKEFERLNQMKNHDDVAGMFGELHMLGVETPAVFIVSTDLKDNSRQIVIATQAGLGIDRERYLEKNEYSLKQQNAYQLLLTKLFTDAHQEDPSKAAAKVMALEKRLAGIQWDTTQNRDVGKTYNMMSAKTLAERMKGFPLDYQLKTLAIPTHEVINVMQPDYFEAFSKLFKQIPLSDWHDYLMARLLIKYAKLLDEPFTEAITEFEISQGLYDKPEAKNLQAINYLNRNAGMLLGKSYIATYFNNDIKQDIKEIVNNIIAEYRLAILGSNRMSERTKYKALEKLGSMTFKIGYPEKWQDFSSLILLPNQKVENHKRLMRYEYHLNLSKLGKPVNKDEWARPPQEINAFYEFNSNSFVLLSGILQEPFYSKKQNLAQKYGGIGFVIGHEIGHAFDDQGSQFDAKGNMVNWWEPEDAQQFDSIKKKLIAQANAYEVLPGKYLKGELEIGEIIGDLSGAEIALRAFQRIATNKGWDKTTLQQDYFKQLAQTWRANLREPLILMLIDKDPHPESSFRTNGIVKNFDEFHAVFGTKPEDKMYTPPEKRVRIW